MEDLTQAQGPHKLIYGILVVLDAASCLGVDKTIVSAMIATSDTMFALDWKNRLGRRGG